MRETIALSSPACAICERTMRDAGAVTSAFSGRRFELAQCTSCWYACVKEPRQDFEVIYDADYYAGRGADPLVNYVDELTDARTIRRYEWRGILDVVSSVTELATESTRWLDLGCGVGGLVQYLQHEGLVGAVGSDSGHAAELMREQGVPFMSSAELESQSEMFDVITSIEVLEHVIDPVSYLESVARLLAPGGIFFMTTGNARPHRDRLSKWSYVIPDVHVSFFEPSTLDIAMRRVGLVPDYVGHVRGYDAIIRYKVLKNLTSHNRMQMSTRVIPWRLSARAIDWRYGVSAFPIGRKTAATR